MKQNDVQCVSEELGLLPVFFYVFSGTFLENFEGYEAEIQEYKPYVIMISSNSSTSHINLQVQVDVVSVFVEVYKLIVQDCTANS